MSRLKELFPDYEKTINSEDFKKWQAEKREKEYEKYKDRGMTEREIKINIIIDDLVELGLVRLTDEE